MPTRTRGVQQGFVNPRDPADFWTWESPAGADTPAVLVTCSRNRSEQWAPDDPDHQALIVLDQIRKDPPRDSMHVYADWPPFRHTQTPPPHPPKVCIWTDPWWRRLRAMGGSFSLLGARTFHRKSSLPASASWSGVSGSQYVVGKLIIWLSIRGRHADASRGHMDNIRWTPGVNRFTVNEVFVCGPNPIWPICIDQPGATAKHLMQSARTTNAIAGLAGSVNERGLSPIPTWGGGCSLVFGC